MGMHKKKIYRIENSGFNSSQNSIGDWVDCRENRRNRADKRARDVLSRKRKAPTEEEVLQALRLWDFEENYSRQNVLPRGKNWVYSDTLGVIEDRNTKQMQMSAASEEHSDFMCLLVRYAESKLKEQYGGKAPTLAFTTISVNKGYQARLHPDANNQGASVGFAVGAFTGGRLKYYPEDSGSGSLKKVKKQRSIVLDLKRKAVVFDGRKAHEVFHFKPGQERYSVIFFTVKNADTIGQYTKKKLLKCGGAFPETKHLRALEEHIPK